MLKKLGIFAVISKSQTLVFTGVLCLNGETGIASEIQLTYVYHGEISIWLVIWDHTDIVSIYNICIIYT